MGALVRALEKRYNVFTGANLENPENWALRVFGGSQNTSAGVDVNERTALFAIDVLTCVKIISETIAQIPLLTYRNIPGGGKKRATNHPLYTVLHDQANEEMTAFVLKETLQAHLLTWGNAYAWIERNPQGDCVGLWPLLPDRTRPVRTDAGELVYATSVKKLPLPGDPGVQRVFPARDVLHIPGFGFDGLVGYSVIQMVREQIGLAQAQEEYAGRFYANGSMPPAFLTYAKALSPDDIKRLTAEWDDGHKGVRNAWKMALLDQGMDIKTLGISQQDAQFIEQRRFSSEKIAGFFRVPPDMVTSSDKAGPYGVGIEQRQIGFAKFTIQPWAVRWEHAVNMKLLLRPRDTGYFSEFLMDGLERADIEKRYNAYGVGFGKWLTTDDIRGFENINPYETPADPIAQPGRVLLYPLNMGSAEQIISGDARVVGPDKVVPVNEGTPALPATTLTPPPPAAGASSRDGGAAPSRRALAKAQRIALADAADRVLRRESTDILARSRKRANPPEWLDVFYEDHRGYIVKQLGPQFRTYAALVGAEVTRELGRAAEVPDAFVTKYIDGYAARHIAASRAEVVTLLGTPRTQMEAALMEWPARSDWAAAREANQAGNAFAHAAYRAAGVPFMVWQTGDACPDCAVLHDKWVAIDARFAQRGELSDDTFVPVAGLGHPPLCDGCECVVISGDERSAPEPLGPGAKGRQGLDEI